MFQEADPEKSKGVLEEAICKEKGKEADWADPIVSASTTGRSGAKTAPQRIPNKGRLG